MIFRTHGHRWMAVLLVLLLSACATPSQTVLLQKTPPNIPSAHEIHHVPFYPQRDYQCGPAALATVINHYALQTTPEALLPLVYIPELKGSLQIEMQAAASRFGRLALALDGRLASLLREVAAGNPVLVMQNLGLEAYPFWHYAVVVGYDLPRQEIILRSGERQRLVRPFALFERTWQRAKHWALVVVPPHMLPVSVSEQQFVATLLEQGSTLSITQQLSAWQSGVTRWPFSFVLQMGEANAYFSNGQYDAAAQGFKRATELDPTRPEAWNNLAYAALKLGRGQAARDAVQHALTLAPDNADYRHSQREIEQLLLKR